LLSGEALRPIGGGRGKRGAKEENEANRIERGKQSKRGNRGKRGEKTRKRRRKKRKRKRKIKTPRKKEREEREEREEKEKRKEKREKKEKRQKRQRREEREKRRPPSQAKPSQAKPNQRLTERQEVGVLFGLFGCLVCLTSLFGCFTFILHLFVALLYCFPLVWLAFSIFPPLSGSPRFPYGLSPSFPALPAGCAGYPGAVFHVGGEALYSPCLCRRVSLFRPPRSPRSTRFTPLRAPSLPSSSTRHCCSSPPCWPTCWRVPAGGLVPTILRHPRALLRNRHAWSSPLPPQPSPPCPPITPTQAGRPHSRPPIFPFPPVRFGCLLFKFSSSPRR